MIQHLSYSSLLLYLNNSSAWNAKYVLNQRDQKTSPSALTGSAFHRYIELKLTGGLLPAAIAEGEIRNAINVEWGKTGSVEKCIDTLRKLIEVFETEYVLPGTTLDIERCHEHKFPWLRKKLLGYVDRAYELDGNVYMQDWKSCSSFDDELTPAHIIQGYTYKWLLEKTYKKPVASFEIVQFKPSDRKKNPDRVSTLTLSFSEHEERAVKQLYKDSLKQMLKKNVRFLPNVRDQYDGATEWERYVERINNT